MNQSGVCRNLNPQTETGLYNICENKNCVHVILVLQIKSNQINSKSNPFMKKNWSHLFTIKTLQGIKTNKQTNKQTKKQPQTKNHRETFKVSWPLRWRLRILFLGKIRMLYKVVPIMFSSPSSQRIPCCFGSINWSVQDGSVVVFWFIYLKTILGWSAGDPKRLAKH